VKLALLLVVPALAACPKKKEEAASNQKAEPERPVPEPRVTTPVPIHELLAYARSKAPGQPLWRVSIDYVRSDGLIDPAFGVVQVWSGALAGRDPNDDPNRPTGAPVKPGPKPSPPQCHHLSWREGVWSDVVVTCGVATRLVELRCTVPIIWERAIAKGAPRDAVARLAITANPRGDEARWTFRIEDEKRGVNVSETFPDDCGLIAEAPDPTVGPDTAPDAIDRTIIQNTIGTVKPAITACGEKSKARGVVKATVKVASDGTTSVTVTQTPDEVLGGCVRRVMERAKFPATRNGGSFSYPFVF
jgi:hypothetical protein